LGKIRDKEVVEPLLKIVKDKEFKNKSEEERKAYLFALAGIGGSRVVPELKKIARKRSWFFGDKDLDTKVLAIKSLGLIDHQESKKALEELSQKGRKQLRDVSKKTLERLNRQLIEGSKINEN
jgi:HEAT repeat protein